MESAPPRPQPHRPPPSSRSYLLRQLAAVRQVLARDPFAATLLLWTLLLVLPLGVRLTGSWPGDLLLQLALAALIVFLYGRGLPHDEPPPRRTLRLLLWGGLEWCFTALFLAAQLPFLFDPLSSGRDYQPDVMAAAVNAMRLGAGTVPSPLAPLLIIAAIVTAGILVRYRPRLRWQGMLWLLLVAGVTLLAYRLPLATAASPAPVGVETLWLLLGGINEPAFRALLLLVCCAAGVLWHQLGWRVTGSRLGALVVLALLWFNPATLHYAHTGLTVPALTLLAALLFMALQRLQDRRHAASAAWLALVLVTAWHPLMLITASFLLVAMLAADEALARDERVRLWGSAWLAAAAVHAVRVIGGVSGLAALVPDPAVWLQPARLLLPWLALPAQVTHLVMVLLVGAVLATLLRLPVRWGGLPLLWLLLNGVLLAEVLPLLLAGALAMAAWLLLLPVLLVLIASGRKLTDRLGMAWLLGTAGAAAMTVSAATVEWWLLALPGLVLLAAQLPAALARWQVPAWLPATILALPLLVSGLWGEGSEWQNLATRRYYRQEWPAAALALAGLPRGAGVYCPLPDSPLPFYFAGQRVFDRLRYVCGPWLLTDYQRADSLFAWCVVRNCRFSVIPRGYHMLGGVAVSRQTALARLAADHAQFPAGFSWPGAWAQQAVRPLAAEELLAGADMRFSLRARLGRGGNELLLVEAGTMDW